MTPRFPFLVAALFAALFSACAASRPTQVSDADLYPDPTQAKATIVINKVLERYHYRKMTLDDKFASQILKNYLTALDANRSFFEQGDVSRRKFEGGQARHGLRDLPGLSEEGR